MNDNLVFTGGGEMDNGWNVSVSLEIDNGDGRGTATTGQILDGRSIAIDTGVGGILTFAGHDGGSVISSTDDKLPNMYEEAWYGGDGPGQGAATSNMFSYSNTQIVDGLNVLASYTPSSDTEVLSSTEFGVAYTGIDGLTVGYATGTDGGAGAASEIDNRTAYVTYAFNSITLGYQQNSSDSKVANADEDYTGMVITYTVTDELAVSYGTAEIDYENSAFDQESSSVGASYTMGSMTLSGVHNTHDNISNSSLASADRNVYELGLSFAF
jgi:outer membrane protein OmpU